MTQIFTMLLSNALLVIPLAVLIYLVTRWTRHPGVVWALWGLVLLKFVTPALVPLPIDVTSHLRFHDEGLFDTIGPSIDRPDSPLSKASSSRQETVRAPTLTAPDSSQVADGQFRDIDGEGGQAWLELSETDDSAITSADRSTGALDNAAVSIPISDFPPGVVATDSQRPRSADGHSASFVPSVVSISTTHTTTFDAAAGETARPSAATTSPGSHNSSPASGSWQLILAAIWVIGSLVVLALALWRIARFRRLLEQATPADDMLSGMASQLAAQFELRGAPPVQLTDGRVPPLLYGGMLRPMILLPRGLVDLLDIESRRTLLAHELAHLARRDHWMRWLELCVRCLYWWHPLAWWSGRRLREAEELCCDARVVALLPDSATAYAHTILTTVEYLADKTSPVPTLATSLEPMRRSVRPLHRRLTMIVDRQPTLRSSWQARVLVATLAVGVLPISMMAQPREEAESAPQAVDMTSPLIENGTAIDGELFSFHAGIEDVPKGDDNSAAATIPDPRIKIMVSSADELLGDLEWIIATLGDQRRIWQNDVFPSLEVFSFGIDRQRPLRLDVLVNGAETTEAGSRLFRWQACYPIARDGEQLDEFIRDNLEPIGINVSRRARNLYELRGIYAGWMRLAEGYASIGKHETDLPATLSAPQVSHQTLLDAGFDIALELDNADQKGQTGISRTLAELARRIEQQQGETSAEFVLRSSLQKQQLADLERLLVDSRRVSLGWTTDRENELGRAKFVAEARPDTALAGYIDTIGDQPSAFAGVTIPEHPLASVRLNLPISPGRSRELTSLLMLCKPVLHERLVSREEADPAQARAATLVTDRLIDMITGGLNDGRFDVMLDLEPEAAGQRPLLAGIRVANGHTTASLLELVSQIDPDWSIETDFDSVGDTAIHTLRMTDGTLYIASGPERVWLCSGEGALRRLKQAIIQANENLQQRSPTFCWFEFDAHRLLELPNRFISERGANTSGTSARPVWADNLRSASAALQLVLDSTDGTDSRLRGEFRRIDDRIEGDVRVSPGLLGAVGMLVGRYADQTQNSRPAGVANYGRSIWPVQNDFPVGPAVVEETAGGVQLRRVGGNLLAEAQKANADGAAAVSEDDIATITVERRSYAIDGTLGPSVVRLLEQVQRSGLVDPLLAHLNGGNGAAWREGKWNYQTSVTVITTPDAHQVIGTFIDDLRELRPSPEESGPEELKLTKVVYDRYATWSTSRSLVELLMDAVRYGHIRYMRISSDQQHRLVITTTEPIHAVIRPFIDFLNEQEKHRDAAVSSDPANPLAGGKLAPTAPATDILDASESESGSGASSGLQAIPPASSGRSLPGGRSYFNSEDALSPIGPGATLPGVPSQRPQVVTAPQESGEMHLVAKVYGLHPAIVQPLGEFLQEVRDGFPFYSGRLVRQGAGRGMFGPGGATGMGSDPAMMSDYAELGYGYDDDSAAGMSGEMMPGGAPQNVATRIFAPAEAQKVLGKFVAALHATVRKQSKQETSDETETIVLIRGEYELAPAAAEKFENLLRTCERHGLATPLMVTRDQTRVKVIAEKDLQTAIREFIAYLSENWKSAARDSKEDSTRLSGVRDPQPYGLPAARRAAGETPPEQGTEHSADLSRDEQLHRVIESIDRVLGDDGKGREKALQAIESRGTEALADRLQEIRREAAASLFPLLDEVERYRDRLGLDHSLVKAQYKKLVLERSKQLEDLAVLDEHPQIQVRAWDRLGILVGPLSPSQSELFRKKGYAGGDMRVALVRPEGPWAKAGLQKDFALLAVNRVAVTSHGDLETALKLVDPDQSQIDLVCFNGNDLLKTKIQLPPVASAQVEGLDLKIAEIELERANEALEFAKRLVEKGYKSQADLKAAELEVLKAQRALEKLRSSSNME